MAVIHVKSPDEEPRMRCEATVRRVLEDFGDSLLASRLLKKQGRSSSEQNSTSWQ
jgi:hypothetical protein